MKNLTGWTAGIAISALLALVFSFSSKTADAKTTDGGDSVRVAQDAVAKATQDPELPDGVEVVADIVYATRGERELRLDVYRLKSAKGPFPAVVLIHGRIPNDRDRHHYAPLAAQLAEQGLVAVCIDRRGPQDAPYPAAVEDARAAVRWLEDNADEQRVRPGEIAALGDGFGGYVAAMLGVVSDGSDAPSVGAVVAIEPVVDLLNYSPVTNYAYGIHLFLGFPLAQRPDLWEQASPLTYVDSRAAPFFLFHPTKPLRNPLAQSTALAGALEEAGVRVKLTSPEGDGQEYMSAPHDLPRFAMTVANSLKFALWQPPDSVQVQKDLVYASPGGRDMRLDLYTPKRADGPLPAVLLMHGGGWTFGSKEDLRGAAAYLAEQGFAAASVEYRLAPERIYPAGVDDVKAAVRWLRANADKYGIDGGMIGATGVSAGGHLSALLAVTPDVTHFAEGEDWPGVSTEIQAAVPISSAVDLVSYDQDEVWAARTWLGGRPFENPELWRQASPTFFTENASCAFLFMHAPLDEACDIGLVETMLQKLLKAGVRAEMYRVEGGAHDFLWDPRFRDAALERMARFFEKELGRGRALVGS